MRCVWEHNGNDTNLWLVDLPGVFARGPSLEAAAAKLPAESAAFLRWSGGRAPATDLRVVQEHVCPLDVRDADSDVLFDSERVPLEPEDYAVLKVLALRSAADFQALYDAVPDKDKSVLPVRTCFYGPVPRTAREMYAHTKNVNRYYFGEIGVGADNDGSILACRERGFTSLEAQPGFLENAVRTGSWNEEWCLAKVLRRFLWHDRLHARALLRMARRTFGEGAAPDVFRFDG